MAERSALYILEEQTASKADGPSCTPSQMAREILGINEVKGLTVVDLASGSSPMVAELIEEGANAHGVDMVYGKTVEELAQAAQLLLYKQVDYAPYGYGQKMLEFGEEAINKFTASFKANRGNYHEAYLTRLPFPDNFADVTTSLNGIMSLADNVELTIERIKEALRITKPGGKLIMAPIHSEYDENFDYFAIQHSEVIEKLEAEGYQIEIEAGITPESELLLPEFTRVTIFKH